MSAENTPAKEARPGSGSAFCRESRRLLDLFGEAVHELVILHEQQFLSIVNGDSECYRFDLLIHMANERKQEAKYVYLHHLETHGCSTSDGFDKS
jgi:tRNA splicing endonuclease